MARRVRLFASLVLLAGVLPARGQADRPAPAADGVKVKVEKADGTEFTGTLTDPTLTLDADFGRAVVDLNKVKTVDVAVHDAKTDVTVTLLDGDLLHGTATAGTIVRVTRDDGGGIEGLSLTAVRELTVLRTPDLSLVAVVSGLVMLTLLEIILGVDNVIFLAILVAKLPAEKQQRARWIGLGAALGTRMALLFSLTWMLGLTRAVVTLPLPFLAPDARDLSWRDIILLAGGLFLIVKSVSEVREKLAADAHAGAGKPAAKAATSFLKTILWIALIDIVFSLDSVITAVGTVDASLVWVMVTAMVIAMLVMLLFAKPIGDFVEGRPTVKILALAFLILIGVLLVAEGFGQHIDKGYIYFAMGFAVLVEFVNLKLRPAKTDVA